MWFKMRRNASKNSLMKKATEACWRCLFYFSMFVYGCVTLLPTEWLYSSRLWFDGYVLQVLILLKLLHTYQQNITNSIHSCCFLVIFHCIRKYNLLFRMVPKMTEPVNQIVMNKSRGYLRVFVMDNGGFNHYPCIISPQLDI